jgi:hypothetical protein
MSGAHPDFLTGPCPCDSCKFRARCAHQLLACAAFSMFLHSARWQNAPRAPTRGIFEATIGHPARERPEVQNSVQVQHLGT